MRRRGRTGAGLRYGGQRGIWDHSVGRGAVLTGRFPPGFVPADEIFKVAGSRTGGRVPFGTRQKEPKTCRGEKSRLEPAKGASSPGFSPPGPPERARGRQLECTDGFPASWTGRCGSSSDGLCPCADRVTAVLRTHLDAWPGVRPGNWRVAGLGGQSKCQHSFPAAKSTPGRFPRRAMPWCRCAFGNFPHPSSRLPGYKDREVGWPPGEIRFAYV